MTDAEMRELTAVLCPGCSTRVLPLLTRWRLEAAGRRTLALARKALGVTTRHKKTGGRTLRVAQSGGG